MQRYLRILLGTVATAALLVVSPLAANAATINFFGDGDDDTQLGAAKTFTADSVSVTANAFEVDLATNAIYTPTDLFQRNELPNDQGLGVCNSEDAGGTCAAQGGDQDNEIDNNTPGGGTVYDVIRLEVVGLDLISLGLSSLDTQDENIDTANIFFSDDGALDLDSVAPDITITELFDGINPDIDISGLTGVDYIYVTGNVSDGANGDDDFLLRNLVARGDQEVPEPATLGLLGLGLAGLGFVRRRRVV